jgi:hypothetical protein
MPYAKGITINEDMLFSKPIKRIETPKELFNIVNDFMGEKCVKWAACIMTENREHAPEAMKELCTELSEASDTVIRSVLSIEKQTFCRIMQGNGVTISVSPVLL